MKIQYYYKDDKCQADNCYKDDCICWHDIGTGPHPDAKNGFGSKLLWRHEPGEVVFTPDMIDAMFSAWHQSGADVAGASWNAFISKLNREQS